MLQKSRRIPRRDFAILKKGGVFLQNDLLQIRFIKQERGKSRFSFSVSKKVSKKASIRNNIRRMGYMTATLYLDNTVPSLVHSSFKRIPEDKDTLVKRFHAMLVQAKLLK